MQSKATTVAEYISELPAKRKEAINRLRKEIKKNLPKGFKEEMSYGMIGYVVPHSLYPPRLSCYTSSSTALFEYCFTEEFCCSVPYVSLRKPKTVEMVYNRI